MADCGTVGEIIRSSTEDTFVWTINNFQWLSGISGIWDKNPFSSFYKRYKSPQFHLSDSSWFLSLSSSRRHFKGMASIGIFLYRVDTGSPRTIECTLRIPPETDVDHAEFRGSGCIKAGDALGQRMFVKLHDVLVKWCTKDSVKFSCQIKLQEKEVVSCAIQTEVPDSVTDKENSKDNVLSLLDTKDVILLTERLKDLLIKGSDHDVKICVKDKEFRAHRSILSARSPVFATMLAQDTNEDNTGTISIEDCDPEIFDEILLYVYSGRPENLTPSNALQLYYCADKYDLPVLKERCAILLRTSLSVESICDVVLLAAKHQENELLDAATEFFSSNMGEILSTVGWQEFLSNNPVEGNELYVKSMEILLARK